MRKISSLSLTLIVAGIFGCGDHDGTGPSVDFPPLPAGFRAEVCIRGNVTRWQTVYGTIADDDCDMGGGHFECWRVRVATAGPVTFDAKSRFDNFLILNRFEYDYENSEWVGADELGMNDDRSASDSNALITATLQPNTDYVIIILGPETGFYRLRLR